MNITEPESRNGGLQDLGDFSPQFGPPEHATCREWDKRGLLTNASLPGVHKAVDASKIEQLFGFSYDDLRRNFENVPLDTVPDGREAISSKFKGVVVLGQKLFESAKHGVSSIHAGKDQVEFSALPCTVLVPVAANIWALCAETSGRTWTFGAYEKALQPLIQNNRFSTFPLVGDLHLDGKPIEAEVLRKLGLFRASFKPPASDSSLVMNDTCTTTVLGHGGRSVIIPCGVTVPLVSTPHGGWRFPTDQDSDILLKDELLSKRSMVVAMQFIGVGIRRYLYHLTSVVEGASSTLKPDDSVLCVERIRAVQSEVMTVQSERYAGKSGIFLDQVHQPNFNPCPTGGQVSGPMAHAMDKLLLERGAELSGVVIGSLKILDKAELDAALGYDSKMVSPELNIACRVVFDDTLRLDEIAPAKRTDLQTWSECYDIYLKSRYGNATDVERFGHLEEVGRIIGLNLRICFGSELCTAGFQNTMNNLSSFGRMVDTEGMQRWESPIQFASLMHSWMSDLGELVRRVAPEGDLKASQVAFRSLLRSLYNNNLVEFDGATFSDRELNVLAATSTASFINGWLEDNGLEFDREEMLSAIALVGELQKSSEAKAEFDSLLDDLRESPMLKLTHTYLSFLANHFGKSGTHTLGSSPVPILVPYSRD